MSKAIRKTGRFTIGVVGLVVAACLSVASVQAQVTIIDQGSCGNSLTWVLTSDSTLTISGSDTMPNYYSSSGSAPWEAYKSGIATVIIGDSVTTIGSNAFIDCINLTAVTIPISVTSIGTNAFEECINLDSVMIPNSVTIIGFRAFYRCIKLLSVTIPDNVTIIGNQAFMNCLSLSSVIIGNSVKTIGGNAFTSCRNLTSVTIPNNVKTIGMHAFNDCSNLMSVTLPDSLITIESNTFSSCRSLTSITIPNSVTLIRENAFHSCSSLASVTIGNSVTDIWYYAFDGCSGLKSITIHAIIPPVISISVYSKENIVFRGIPDTIPIFIPCGTYDSYSRDTGWSYFSNFIDPARDTNFYSVIFRQGETYSDSNFTNLTKEGKYCITLQSDSDCDSVICLELRYDYTDVSEVTSYELRVTSYEVYDVMGRNLTASLRGLSVAEVRSNPEMNRLLHSVRNDVSHLPTGIYILRMQTNQGIITKKIINL